MSKKTTFDKAERTGKLGEGTQVEVSKAGGKSEVGIGGEEQIAIVIDTVHVVKLL